MQGGGRERLVILGNCMVGHRFLEMYGERAAAAGGGPFDVTVIGEEPRLAYDRVGLSTAPRDVARVGLGPVSRVREALAQITGRQPGSMNESERLCRTRDTLVAVRSQLSALAGAEAPTTLIVFSSAMSTPGSASSTRPTQRSEDPPVPVTGTSARATDPVTRTRVRSARRWVCSRKAERRRPTTFGS